MLELTHACEVEHANITWGLYCATRTIIYLCIKTDRTHMYRLCGACSSSPQQFLLCLVSPLQMCSIQCHVFSERLHSWQGLNFLPKRQSWYICIIKQPALHLHQHKNRERRLHRRREEKESSMPLNHGRLIRTKRPDWRDGEPAIGSGGQLRQKNRHKCVYNVNLPRKQRSTEWPEW